jgi:hypothetical protein
VPAILSDALASGVSEAVDRTVMASLPPALTSSLEEKRPWQDDPLHSYELVGFRLKHRVPDADLVEARRLLEIACKPADSEVLVRELIKLRALTAPGPGSLGPGEGTATLAAYAEALSEYPADAVLTVLRRWVRNPLFAGVFAIFGHGNVAGIGEALYEARERLPTLRAHNEQAMGLAAIAFAKASRRRRMMACTSSIGPGATNLVTAAAVAHANRLPLLLLPGDVFASRRPDPVLQQVEVFGDPTVSVNDCFRPVSRWWDRISRPEQILESLPQALRVLTDPAGCGPVTLALPQDVQTEAYDYPEGFFAPHCWKLRRPPPDAAQLADAGAALTRAKAPPIVAGGGVHYALAGAALADFAARHGIPVAETQAGKGALTWDHLCAVGAIGVTGSSAANALAAEADVILAIGSRLSDFTTASRTLFCNPELRLIELNIAAYDAVKHGALPLVADAQVGLGALRSGARSQTLVSLRRTLWCHHPPLLGVGIQYGIDPQSADFVAYFGLSELQQRAIEERPRDNRSGLRGVRLG